MGQNAFQGTQPYLNNAIGSANAGAEGALLPPGAVNFENNAASGGLLNPQQNQYLQQYYQAAAQPLKQEYRNVTEPNILANAAETGTVGGSGQQAAQNAANLQLSTGLSDLAANIYEPAYAQNLQATQNAYGTNLGATESAISGAPGLAQGAYIPSQQLQGQAAYPYQAANQIIPGIQAGAGTGSQTQLTTGGGTFK